MKFVTYFEEGRFQFDSLRSLKHGTLEVKKKSVSINIKKTTLVKF